MIWGTVPRLVEDAAVRHASLEALVEGDVRLTLRRAGAPRSTATPAPSSPPGVDAGDRVAMWAPNCAEWMLAALGALRAGAVLVPLNTRFKGAEAAYILRSSGATLLVTVRGFLGVDYPALLVGEDVGDLERIVLLRDATADRRRSAARLRSSTLPPPMSACPTFWPQERRSTPPRRPAGPTPSDPTTPPT